MESKYHFNFEDLIVYQKPMDFREIVFNQLKKFPKNEDYRLSSQLVRAADSIAFNTAEGSGSSYASFLNYLRIARDSSKENVYQLLQKHFEETILHLKTLKITEPYHSKSTKCYLL